MDIFNLPKLIEQGVYDVMMWIMFFPATVIRMVFRPRKTLAYVREQALEDPNTAFADAMRPALFLAIAIIIGGFFAPDDIEALQKAAPNAFGKLIYGSWTTAAAFSVIASCMIPLVGALMVDLLTPGKVTRTSMRIPFDQQCYVGAPSTLLFAFLVGAGETTIGMTATLVIAALLAIWLIAVEYIYFRDNSELNPFVCLALALVTLAVGFSLFAAAGILAVGIPVEAVAG